MTTIDDYGRRLRTHETTAVETTNDCLRHVESENGRLNAFITVMKDDAERQAREADRELASGHDRGALHGVPISIKDVFDMRGASTTAASRVREGHVARSDAAAIVRLRRAGAILIGKTNLHEFAFGTTNEDSAFGPARNPADPTRSPGGSSGGSAASVASGMVLATLGTDTGGSVRIPAAACGLVGLKPTYAEIPIDGVVPLSKRMDHVGPLTASVMDAWHVYRALLGQGGHRTLTALPVKTMRIGVLRRYFCDTLDRDVRARFDESLDRLRRAGAHLEDVRIGHADCIAPVYTHISFGDAAAYHATTLATMPERYTPPVRLRLEAARTVLAEDYVRALAGKECLTREVDAILTEHDAILLPTLAIPAPPVGASAMDVDGTAQPIRPLMLKLTQLFNLTGHPAVSVPCGRTSEGLPVGLQIVGARSQTEALLRVALGVEALLFQ